MIRMMCKGFMVCAICAALAMSLALTVHAQSITFVGSTTGSDYSAGGLNLGTAGYWFANFAATVPVDGAAIDANDRDALPSWVGPIDPTPDTTFSLTATTSGGHTPWAFLTLPSGENGLSGAVVDSNTAGNSNNTIPQLDLGPGVPSRFLFHVVTDNTAGEHDPASRLRARAEDPGVFDISGPNAPTGLATNMDGSPDVYTWLFEGMTDTSFIKLQLNSGNALESASISGIMFDVVVPEPSSVILLLTGVVGCGWAAVRRRRRG